MEWDENKTLLQIACGSFLVTGVVWAETSPYDAQNI